MLPTAHGSGLFQRGETQVLNVATLGMPRMDQMLDTLGIDDKKRYMHHYNMPPYSTGETGFMRRPEAPRDRPRPAGRAGPGAGGADASRSSPTRSASCPTCCRRTARRRWGRSAARSLSLMDAGVPIKAPVAGIAMGLVFAEGKYTTLTDILGAEDAFGDMDFKVAGTAEFVTALQLDTKIDGIPADVLGQALEQAKEARLQDPRGHARRHRRAPRRGRRHRAEDRQLRDPDRQDRRGHRAQGQGHQRHPAGDRRRHHRRRRRHGRHRDHRLDRRRRGRPRPSARSSSSSTRRPPRSAQRLHGQGREHHQVRCVRQHPPRP